MSAQLVWWRSRRRTTSCQPPSTSFSSQGWKSKWPTRCFGQRRLDSGHIVALFEFLGGMFWGSCFNCGSDKQGRRGHAITCRHVNFHGGSLIDAFAIMSHDAQCSFHNFEDTCLPNTVWQTANLKLAFGNFLFSCTDVYIYVRMHTGISVFMYVCIYL